MRNALKWLGIVVGVLVVLVVIAGGVIYAISSSKIHTTYEVAADAIPVPTDSASIAHGAHLAETFGCIECHGADLAGGVIVDDPVFATVYAANLTKGEGGIGATHSDAELVRSIREGVRLDGTSVWIMPSESYHVLNDADVASIVAWIRTKPPVNKVHPPRRGGPVGRFLLATGKLPDLLTAALIDRAKPRAAPVPAGPTAAYGGYLASMCRSCHGADFSGGIVGQPGAPPSRNLTPAGNLSHWSREDFITAMRTGMTPEHYQLNPDYMPWKSFGHATDDELTAVYLYLKTLPPKETPAR